jgi:hypothetical protein
MDDAKTAIEAAIKLYRYDARARQIVDMCVAHGLNERGEPDERDFARYSADVATEAVALLLRYIYDNDGEIQRLVVERDHWKQLAENGLNLTPLMISDEWWPPDFERRPGNVLMEFPEQIKSLQRIGDRVFVTLDDGKVIDVTELLGNPKH